MQLQASIPGISYQRNPFNSAPPGARQPESPLSRFGISLKAAYARYCANRGHRQTVESLSALSDRQLSDAGLPLDLLRAVQNHQRLIRAQAWREAGDSGCTWG